MCIQCTGLGSKEGLATWPEARSEDIAQAQRYLAELLPDHPLRVCFQHLVYASGNAEFRFF
ncbi:MAG: hypothetical protein ACOYM2_10225 [Rectinemataceae bacterium]